MSDISSAAAVAPVDSSVVMGGRGIWRDLLARLAAPCIALWRRLRGETSVLPLHNLGESELLDIGASPELIAESQALREFEVARANALCHYYW
jgi:hypothetical protein